MGLEEAVEYATSVASPAPSGSPASGDPSTKASPVALTRREEELATLVARGLTNRQIAMKLSISEHTTATHVRSILKKRELSSRSQIAAWITEQGLKPAHPT